ncbi:MAG: hypothetical protein Q9164_002472 [Protoblastenia rupestris]
MTSSPPLDWSALEEEYSRMMEPQENGLSTSIDSLFEEMDPIVFPKQCAATAIDLAPRAADLRGFTALNGDDLVGSSTLQEFNNVEADKVAEISSPEADSGAALDDFGFDLEVDPLGNNSAAQVDLNINFDQDFEEFLAMQDKTYVPLLEPQHNVGSNIYEPSTPHPCLSVPDSGLQGRLVQSTPALIPLPASETQGTALFEPDLSWMDAPMPQQPTVRDPQRLSLGHSMSHTNYDLVAPQSCQDLQIAPSHDYQGLSNTECDPFAFNTQTQFPQLSPTTKQSESRSAAESQVPKTRSRAQRIGRNGMAIGLPPVITYAPDPAYDTKPLCKPTEKPTEIDRANPKYQENEFYTPLAAPPQPWDCFRYNASGELDPAQLYTPAEITRYLFSHPLHHGQNTQMSPLKIWIQRNPPNSKSRYPSIYSHRCRFSTCPLSTINQGHYCAAFDEQTMTKEDHDPFITAGYVHLWCLERFCDLPKICAELNISPAKRCAPLEPRWQNLMRLNTLTEEQAVASFKESCRSGTLPSSYPRFDQQNRPHAGTLTHTLSLIKLKREPKSVSRQRVRRIQQAGYQGSTLTTHQGDLDVEASLRGRTRLHKNQNQIKERQKRRRGFFKHIGDEEDGSASEEEEEEEAEGVGQPLEEHGCNGGPKMRQESATYVPPVAQMVPGPVQPTLRGQKRGHEACDPTSIASEPVQKRRITMANCSTALLWAPSPSSKSSSATRHSSGAAAEQSNQVKSMPLTQPSKPSCGPYHSVTSKPPALSQLADAGKDKPNKKYREDDEGDMEGRFEKRARVA